MVAFNRRASSMCSRGWSAKAVRRTFCAVTSVRGFEDDQMLIVRRPVVDATANTPPTKAPHLGYEDGDIQGAADRLIPILMASLVTGLGLLPLALGAGEPGREIEGPMALRPAARRHWTPHQEGPDRWAESSGSSDHCHCATRVLKSRSQTHCVRTRSLRETPSRSGSLISLIRTLGLGTDGSCGAVEGNEKLPAGQVKTRLQLSSDEEPRESAEASAKASDIQNAGCHPSDALSGGDSGPSRRGHTIRRDDH